MKINYYYSLRLKALVATFLIICANYSIAQITTLNYTSTGAVQTFTVPNCVSSITITARGAQGGAAGYSGGYGGIAAGVLTVTAGQVLYINVGGTTTSTLGGFNGGGNGGVSPASAGGGGGGASDVRLNANTLSARFLVAGGGGGSGGSTSYNATAGNGGGGSNCSSPFGVGGGGAGGCASGSSGGCTGGAATSYGTGGGGGGLSSGGSTAGSSTGSFGGAGTSGLGGDGGSYAGASYCNGGGGGGGGYYGGAGGMSGSGGCNGGGGGGSSFGDNTMLSNISFTANTSTGGAGLVTLSYITIGTVTAVANPTSICNGGTATLSASGQNTYTWSTSSNASSITVNPSSNASYTVSATNSLGCVSVKVITVAVNASAPVLSVASSTNQICLGKTVTLTASGALTYTWTGGVTNGVSFSPTTTQNYTVLGQNGCGTTSAVTTVTVAPLQVNTLSSSSVICAGYPVTLTAVSAGTSYTWQPFSLTGQTVVVTPTTNTTYTVSVSDGTCSGVANISIGATPVPTVTSASSSSFVCGGTTVTLTANGAQSYTWTPGNIVGAVITVTPNSPIQYSVAGSNAAGCLAGSSQVIIVNPSPTINVSASDNVICDGGSATLTVNGADTYAWNTSATSNSVVVNPTQSTVYSVVGTSSVTGCSTTGTVNVDVFSPSITVSGSTVICLGGTSSLTASGANSYTWLPNSTFPGITVSPSVTTVYSVIAISNSLGLSCSSSNSIEVTVNPNPTVQASATRTSMCKGESVVFSASGASSYLWSNSTSTSVATSSSVTITSSVITTIIYTVTGTNSFSCSASNTVQVKVNGCNGIEELSASRNALVVYPNPARGEFNLQHDSDIELTVVNELGQAVRTVNLNSANNYKATVSGLKDGIYIVTGKSAGKAVAKKIIVNN